MSAAFRHELPFGATVLAGGRTRFRLWAPAQDSVSVDIDGRAVAMKRSDNGWFETEATCGAGAAYRFVLGDGTSVPDPASRAQNTDVHDLSLVVDSAAYRWQHADWQGRPWRDTVLYEVHAGTFGGFAGVMGALPRLKEIGITAIELMPIADFPGKRNWGYDGVLPYAPDRAYGTPNELKALIDAAHGHGLMMFLDVVYNHFGPDGNYLGAYAPQMFRNDIHTPWGGAIDFRVPEVRQFFTENALYWLMEYRFDGLRFDAVHAIADSDWLDEMAHIVRSTIEPGRHVHLVLENEKNEASHLANDFDAQWNDDGHNVLHVLLTGEKEAYYRGYVEDPAQKLARCLAEGFIYQGDPSPHHDGKPRGSQSGHLPPTAFVLFLQNHDQTGNRAFGERLTELADPEALEAATALQLLCPQIPLIFMGEETGSKTPFLFFTDHHGELAEAVREGRRKEFAGFASFADPKRRAMIPDPNAAATFEQSIPKPDLQGGTARETLYRTLLRIRHAEIVSRLDGAKSAGAQAIGPAAVVARWTMGDGAKLTLVANLGSGALDLDTGLLAGKVLFESKPGLAEAARKGALAARTTVALLEAPA